MRLPTATDRKLEVMRVTFDEQEERLAEADEPRAVRQQLQPTAGEIAIHEVAHLPYGSWRCHCVRGKGRATEKCVYIVDEIGYDNLVPSENGDDNLAPCVIGYDDLVPSENGDDNLVPYVIGYDNLVSYMIGCDNLAPKSVPAPYESLEGDDDGDGTTECASLAVQGQVRVMKDCLELELRTATTPENAATKRLARHAAWTPTTYQKDNDGLTAHQEIRGKTFDVQEAAFDEAVAFKPHKADGHVKNAAPQRRDGVWIDFNSMTHEHIVRGEGEIVPYETIHRKKAESVWCKQLVLDRKRGPLNVKGGDAPVGHMVVEDSGEGQTGEPSGQIGKGADITESTVGDFGATYGCRG